MGTRDENKLFAVAFQLLLDIGGIGVTSCNVDNSYISFFLVYPRVVGTPTNRLHVEPIPIGFSKSIVFIVIQ